MAERAVTHADLVERARRWLRSGRWKCPLVLAEMQTIHTYEQPDVIGWDYESRSVLVEVKASRADFRRDGKKLCRRARRGMGQRRFFFAEAGVIPPEEVPEGWGLAEVHHANGRTIVRVKVEAPWRGPYPYKHCGEVCRDEVPFLVAAVRKIQSGQQAGLERALGLGETEDQGAT